MQLKTKPYKAVVSTFHCGAAVQLWCCGATVVLRCNCGAAVQLWCCGATVVLRHKNMAPNFSAANLGLLGKGKGPAGKDWKP